MLLAILVTLWTQSKGTVQGTPLRNLFLPTDVYFIQLEFLYFRIYDRYLYGHVTITSSMIEIEGSEIYLEGKKVSFNRIEIEGSIKLHVYRNRSITETNVLHVYSTWRYSLTEWFFSRVSTLFPDRKLWKIID